jgi:hypothetical protein
VNAEVFLHYLSRMSFFLTVFLFSYVFKIVIFYSVKGGGSRLIAQQRNGDRNEEK